MSHDLDGLDMDLASGIAAFESKQFSRATGLLAPLAERVMWRRSTGWRSWPKTG